MKSAKIGATVAVAIVASIAAVALRHEQEGQRSPHVLEDSLTRPSIPQAPSTPHLNQSGERKPSAAEDGLAKIIIRGKQDEISRAFRDLIYSNRIQAYESQLILRKFLPHSDTFIRFCAAEALLKTGDRSAIPTLISIVELAAASTALGEDLRLQAARLLGKFRVIESLPQLSDLFSRAKTADLELALARLGSKTIDKEGLEYVGSERAILEYGLIGATNQSSYVYNSFFESKDPRVRSAAAWFIYKVAGDSTGAQYLAEASRPFIASAPRIGQLRSTPGAMALQYISSLSDPSALKIVNSAAESQNSFAVQVGTASLVLVQGDPSGGAKRRLLKELRGESKVLGRELLMALAVRYHDADIVAAGQAFDAENGEGAWQAAFERRDWPVYNWVDNYINGY